MPDALPVGIAGVEAAAAAADAGVRTEQVDAAVPLERGPDDTDDFGFVTDIGDQPKSADRRRDLMRARVAIDHDDGPRSFTREPLHQRPPDPARAAGDDDDGVMDVHSRPFLVPCSPDSLLWCACTAPVHPCTWRTPVT